MKVFSKVLSILYFVGFFLHFLDLLNLRLNFAEMSTPWKAWIVYLTLLDLIASVGLWKQKIWGELVFISVALSQLIVYVGFKNYFGSQEALVWFHIFTLAIYVVLKINLHLKNIKTLPIYTM